MTWFRPKLRLTPSSLNIAVCLDTSSLARKKSPGAGCAPQHTAGVRGTATKNHSHLSYVLWISK
jgi:hypothetical protein